MQLIFVSGVTNSAFSTYLSTRWLSSFVLCTHWMTAPVYSTGIQFNWQCKTKINQQLKARGPVDKYQFSPLSRHASRCQLKLSFEEKNRSTCCLPRSRQRQDTLNSFLRSTNTFCLISGHRTRLNSSKAEICCSTRLKSQSGLAWLFLAFVP